MTRRPFLLSAALALLGLTAAARAEARHFRYRLIAPAADTAASLAIVAHALDDAQGVSQWWGQPLPGLVSKSGLYVPAGEWSDWRRLPNPPVWGTITLHLQSADPLPRAVVEVDVATAPDESARVRRLSITNTAGPTVGFVLPGDILTHPEWIESLPETFARRRRVAESCAIPEARRPKRLTFAPSTVTGHATVAGSQDYEADTLRLLGFNTLDTGAWPEARPGFPFRNTHGSGAKGRLAGQPPPVYSIVVDEPGWESGFAPVWAQSGQDGFRQYLEAHGVAPAELGAASLDGVMHLPRREVVPADAPLERRRLWYWSCRYTYDACALHFKSWADELHQNLTGTLATVNYPTHSVTLNRGMIAGYGADYLAVGRAQALSLYWAEDWLFSRLTSWGNGLYAKVAYLAELMRSAARYHPEPRPPLGFHVVSVGYDPFGEGSDPTVPLRVNLLLGRGVKHLSFFNYGPTHGATIDFWADAAPVMRGTAEAISLTGGERVEPLLAAGEPVPAETCLIFGTTAEYWQTQNGADANNLEKIHTYAALTQGQIPVEIIDAFDLERFIANYKAAYLVDWNIERASAVALRRWVENGGVLCLWPAAAARDEYNAPLEIFPEAAGTHTVGRGRIVRWPDAPGAAWWGRSVELSRAAGSDWPSHFDAAHRERLAAPALALAQVKRPVVADFPDIIANALVSPGGVAVPLVNLRGTYDTGGTRYLNVTIRVADGAGLNAAWSARHGALPLRHEADGSAAVVMPLDSTDILVFTK
jgi:hypothetical protein